MEDTQSNLIIRRVNFVALSLLFVWVALFGSVASHRWQTVIVSILAAFLPISMFFDLQRRRLVFTKHELSLWVFLLAMLGGMIGTKSPSIAQQYYWRYIFPIPFIYFFAKATFETRKARTMLKVVASSAALVCIFGIIEMITGFNFIYEKFANSMYYSLFVGKRMISTHIHPTALGTYLVAVFPLAIALVLRAKRPLIKYLSVINVVVIFFCIILTASRGALFGALAGIFVMMRLLSGKRRIIKIVLPVVGIFLVVVTVSSILEYYGAPLDTRYSLQELSQKFSYAVKSTKIFSAARILRDHPFLGLGFGHFRVLFNQYLPTFANWQPYDHQVPDLMYLAFLTETGLIGFGAFLLFIIMLFRRVKSRLATLPEGRNRIHLVCFLSGFVAMLCAFLTYDGLYWYAPRYLFWSYAGVLSFLTQPGTLHPQE